MEESKRVIPNRIIFGEVLNIISNKKEAVLRTKGNSMLPFIKGEKDYIILSGYETLEVGDIVMARVSNGRYIVHRIYKIENDLYILMGDGNLSGQENCRERDIIAKVTAIIRGGTREISTSSAIFRKVSSIWRFLLPIRKYLLAVYRFFR